MNKKQTYLFKVQKFLDLTENIEDIELKGEIRNSFFSALRAICDVADFNIDSLREDDIIIITADHGNDPTFKGNNHTRENEIF